MRKLRLMVSAACGLFLMHGAGATVSISYVSVGDAGNDPDVTTGFGAVGYDFNIGKYETTLDQYAEFLNAVGASDPHGLYNDAMGTVGNIAGITRSGADGSYRYAVTGSGSRPVTYVGWLDAARFVNWMSNGQGSGSTEMGVYALGGASSGIFTAAVSAMVRLPTEDEWYKAAYYDPTIGSAVDEDNYHLYATRSSTILGNDLGVGPDLANFRDGDFTNTPGDNSFSFARPYLTDVGAFSGSASYYGTFDQSGNVWEWNDAVISVSRRGLRGGAWTSSELDLSSLSRGGGEPLGGSSILGFRIVSVPEPSAGFLLLLGGLLMFNPRWRG